MFQFSGFAHLSVYYVFNIVGCPIQVSTDQSVCARPRSFSQLITPFIASESQGIPRVPFLTFFYHCRLLLGTVCFLILAASLEPRLSDSGCKTEVLFLVSCFLALPSHSSPLYCCLLFYFTSSNMSKNVLSVCSCLFAVCSY